MNRLILGKELRYLRWILIIFFFIKIGIVLTIGLTYHYTIQFLEEIPKDLYQLLKEYRLSRSFLLMVEDYETYVWSQWNGKNLLQLGCLLSIIMAALQFAGEKSKKTMSFYLTRPLNHNQAYTGKILAGILILFVLFGTATLLLVLLSILLGFSLDSGRFIMVTTLSLFWLSCFYLFCTVISMLSNEPIPAGAIMGGCALLLSLFGLFSSTQHLSLFYQISGNSYFILDTPYYMSLVPSLFIAGLLFKIALIIWNRIDFS